MGKLEWSKVANEVDTDPLMYEAETSFFKLYLTLSEGGWDVSILNSSDDEVKVIKGVAEKANIENAKIIAGAELVHLLQGEMDIASPDYRLCGLRFVQISDGRGLTRDGRVYFYEPSDWEEGGWIPLPMKIK